MRSPGATASPMWSAHRATNSGDLAASASVKDFAACSMTGRSSAARAMVTTSPVRATTAPTAFSVSVGLPILIDTVPFRWSVMSPARLYSLLSYSLTTSLVSPVGLPCSSSTSTILRCTMLHGVLSGSSAATWSWVIVSVTVFVSRPSHVRSLFAPLTAAGYSVLLTFT